MSYEVNLRDFGGMMFQMMQGKKKDCPTHWASIYDEAKPLVEQLLKLNDKMVVDGKKNGYTIIGRKKNGKPVRSKREIIDLAVHHFWKVKVSELKEGDQLWLLNDSDFEMYPFQDNPLTVDDVNEKKRYVLTDHPYERNGIFQIGFDDEVLKAPADYDTNKEYHKDEYWLARAKELDL